MKLVAATNNIGKLKELKKILSSIGIEVLSLKDIELSINVVEDGSTFEENSFKKANEVCNLSNLPSLADDSGLEVDFLNGAPGVYSARFAGEGASDEENNKKLLELLKDVDLPQRTARFVSVITAVFPDGRSINSRGECEGIIINEGRGSDGFGYDPIFYCPPLDKTFAEMSLNEKNEISHRARALEGLKEKLMNEIKK